MNRLVIVIAICFIIFMLMADIGLIVDRQIITRRNTVLRQQSITMRRNANNELRRLNDMLMQIRKCRRMSEVEDILNRGR